MSPPGGDVEGLPRTADQAPKNVRVPETWAEVRDWAAQVVVLVGPRLPDSILGQHEPRERTGTVQKIPDPVSGELSTLNDMLPQQDLSVLDISRNDLAGVS